MLPNRPRLQGWNPDSLSAAATGITAAARSVSDAVNGINDEMKRMPETRAWSGKSHEAAEAAFHRAHRQTSSFTDYGKAVATALSKGSAEIGTARTTLLNTADRIDAGPLHVSDEWVVMIDQATMSAEQAAGLQKLAEAEQASINQLLLAVGDADDETAAAVQSAATEFGYVPPEINLLGGLGPPPGNEVPSPRWPDGLIQQDIIRKNDMATSVREQTVKHTSDDQVVTTLIMQDGSKHTIHEWGHQVPHISDDYYDPTGKFISGTTSFHNPLNDTDVTEIQYGDGTVVTMTKTADGKLTGGVVMADGRSGPLPDEFFTHPALTTVQGGLTLLDKGREVGGRGIPMLSADALERAGKIGKFAGPAVGVATAIFDVVTAKTLQDACVATVSGTFGITGGEATGAIAAFAGAEAPAAVPWLYAGGSMLGGWTFGYLGGIVGNAVCR